MPKHLRILKTALAVSLLMSSIQPLESILYVWQGTNVNQNLNVNTNWSPVGIPTAGDGGQFTSSTTGLSPTLTGGVGFDIDIFHFTNVAGADSYNFLITNNSGLRFFSNVFSPSGVLVDSAMPQTFNVTQDSFIRFNASSSADIGNTGLVTYNIGDAVLQSRLDFFDNSSAGAATINATFNTTLVNFSGTSTGGANASVNLTNNAELRTDHALLLGAVTADSTTEINISGTLTLGTSGNQTINGVIDNNGGAGSINKIGSGTLTFGNTNTYTGGTTVSAGTLLLNNVVLPSAGNLSIVSGANVDFERSAGSANYNQAISGGGNLLYNQTAGNTGTLNLFGTKTYTGSTNVGGGILSLRNSVSGGLTGPITIATGAILNIENTAATTTTYSGAITGGGGITINQTGGNTGSVAISGLSGNTNYTGSTTITNGSLLFDVSSATPTTLTGPISIGPAAAVDFEQAASTSTNYSGAISGNGNILVNGGLTSTGTVIFSNPATSFSGTLTLSRGTLRLDNVNLSSGIVLGAGSTNPIVDLESSGTLNFTGLISGAVPASLLINSQAGNTGTVILNQSPSFTGNTSVLGGTLTLNNNVLLPGNVSIASGANLDFEKTAAIETYVGDISGAGNLRINMTAGNTGTVELTGNKTYTGTTTIGGGTLRLTNNSTTLPGAVTIASGANLDVEQVTGTSSFGGTITGAGNVIINQVFGNAGQVFFSGLSGVSYSGSTTVASGVLVFDNSTTVSLAGPISVALGATVGFEQDPTTIGTYAGQITGAGNVAVNVLSGSTGRVIFSGLTGAGNYTGTTTVNGGTLEFNVSSVAPTTLTSLITVAAGATLDFEQAATTQTTYSGQITGGGNVLVNQTAGNTGAVIFSNATTNYTGTTNVGAGTLEFVDFAPTNTITNNGTIDFESSSTVTYSNAISGSGAVTINNDAGLLNTGLVIFNGANTYTGPTTITLGSLRVFSPGATISSTSAFNINNAAATLDLEQVSGTGSYSGSITGPGNLIVNGVAGSVGRIRLGSAANAYTGSTTISGGVLEVTSSGATISSTSSYNINSAAAQLDIEQTSGSGSFSGPIMGSGSLAVNTVSGNTGTVNLSQALYTGPTSIAGGALQFSGIIPATSSIALTNASTVGFNVAGNYAGNITGNGNLIANPGLLSTLTLSGLSGTAYTGTTTVNSGTLTFNNTSPSVTLGGPITLNGGPGNPVVVDFEQAAGTTGSYNGNITGSGSAVINAIVGNSGTVFFNGVNSYNGGTTVSGGTLQGNTSSLQGAIANNATVTFNQTADGIFTGTFTGPTTAVINKSGAGMLTFNTNNSGFLGTTNILQGHLRLLNILGGNVVVHSGSRLSGAGTILGDLTVNSGAVVAPGTSVGTINVGGNYTQFGNYEIQVVGAQNSLINVTGIAVLAAGSSATVIPSGVVKIQQPYAVITTAGGLSGAFSSVTSTNPLYVPEAFYDAFNAYLRFSFLFTAIAATNNQIAVAIQLESITDPTAAEAAILETLASLPLFAAQEALDQMSAQQYTNLFLSSETSSRLFIRRLYAPVRSLIATVTHPCRACCEIPILDCCGPCDQCGAGGFGFGGGGGSIPRAVIDVWGEVSGGRRFFDGNRNADSFRINDYEFTLGAHTRLNNGLLVGVAGSYEMDHINYDIGGSGKSHNGLGAVYALYRPLGYYLLSDLVFGYRNEKVRRTVDVGLIHLEPRGNPQVYNSTVYLEAGKDCIFNCMLIQPFLGLEAGYYWYNGFSESGGDPLNVIVASDGQSLAYSRLGVHFTTQTLPCKLSLGFDLAWQYRLTSQGNNIRERFADFGSSFTIEGFSMKRNSVDAALRLVQGLGRGWELFAEMDGQWWQNAFSYSFMAGIKANW